MKTRTAIFVLIAAAGCLDSNSISGYDPTTAGENADPYGLIQTMIQDVPCEAPANTIDTSANLRLLANLTFLRQDDRPDGAGELDLRGDLLVAARDRGFSLVDLANPLQPTILSNFADADGDLDAKFSPDNRTVLVGGPKGIELVDVSVPTEPRHAGRWNFSDVPSIPRGPSGGYGENAHMLATARIADQDWVFLAPNSGTGVWVLELVGPPGDRSLRFVTTTLPLEGGLAGPHDMFVDFDPVLKTWLLYEADGFHGWAAFDIRDPARPTLVGGVVRPESGYTHTVQAAWIGSRRLVATIQEIGVNTLELYDATLLQAPVLIGTWQVSRGTIAPQHNINIVAGKLYMAHYTNGLFVFDLTKVEPLLPTGIVDMQPVAHYAGSRSTPSTLGFGDFWDVVVGRGIVYASGVNYTYAPNDGRFLGLHVLGFGCNRPGDVSLTSRG